MPAEALIWHKVLDHGLLAEGRVTTVTAGTTSMALCHFAGVYAAMDNRCPHQGGPLGEGSIEIGIEGKCWLRCPWHGWDFDPLTGVSPGGHDDTGQKTYPVEAREDGIYVGVEPPKAHERTVSDVMAQTMVNWGVKSVFGMVGHSNLGLADALRLQEEAGALRFYGIRHEGAASFACSGYAKLSGKPAACLSIAGPGATNLLTGLWDAKVDRAPVLALTGQVDIQVLGPGTFQEIDLASAFQAVAKFSQTVLTTSRHAELMSLAAKSALVMRDVSHLIFPDDVQTLPAPEKLKAGTPEGRMGLDDITPASESVERAAAMISAAKRPIIIVGYGARGRMEPILELAARLNAPILTTFKAKGIIADSHPHSAGVLGRSGTPVASWFMNECDLIVALGSSFSKHTGIEPSKPVIQVDFDAMHLGKYHPVTLPIWGEIRRTCLRLLETLPAATAAIDQLPELRQRWAIWRTEKAARLREDRGRGVSASAVFDSLTRTAPEDAIIAADVGNNAYSFGRYFEPKANAVLMSGYLGSIGFAFPAAMGAWAATQDFAEHKGRKVISVSGDGGFGQYMAEFTTAVKYGMNITHLLLNNSELGKISKEQRAGEWPVWQTSLVNPDFAAYATLCGGLGIRVRHASELDAALREAFAHPGSSLVQVDCDVDLV
ncbi:MAG: Rieske 2Fe-2S domain-containing protein [Beijerinckiaceae bacterium]|nr:Rieske 2Fe-2S domain-containing protein [Beijerinckiaceae bacterium]